MTLIRRLYLLPNGLTKAAWLALVFFASNAFSEEILPEMEITNIQSGVYLHKSYQNVEGWGMVSSNGLVVVEEHNAFIVSTPWSESDTKKLVEWIEAQGWVAIGSLSTHSHEDRTAGIEWLNERAIPTYASTLTNSILKEEGKVLATNSFDSDSPGSAPIELAGGLVEAFYPGPGHTVDNLAVWLPEAKVLYGGCFTRSLGSTGLGYTGEANISEWSNSVERLITKYPEVQTVVPGHGKPGGFELLTHTKSLAKEASLSTN